MDLQTGGLCLRNVFFVLRRSRSTPLKYKSNRVVAEFSLTIESEVQIMSSQGCVFQSFFSSFLP